MKNNFGVRLPEYLGDITIMSYPNVRIYGALGGNRKTVLLKARVPDDFNGLKVKGRYKGAEV